MTSTVPAALQARRRRIANGVLFLGPAGALLALFFLAPIVVNFLVAFSDMERVVEFTDFPTTEQFRKIVRPDEDALLGYELRGTFERSLGITAVYVVSTLAFFNLSFALILALTTTAVPDRLGAFYRAVWLLPRMSPSVVYGLLWVWSVDPTERGLVNQIAIHLLGADPINMRLDHPILLIVLANGFIGASLGMIIFTSAIRSIPEHLFHAARADGAGPLSIVRHVVLPALRWPISYITVYQALALIVSFEYIFLIMGDARQTQTLAVLAYTRSLAPQSGGGQYAYGAAISMLLIIIGIVAALALWRLTNMQALLQRPRIETD